MLAFADDIIDYVGVELDIMNIITGVISVYDIADEQQSISVNENAFNLSTYGANYVFNPDVPNVSGVEYQSWAAAIMGETDVYGFPWFSPIQHNIWRGINLAFNPSWGYMLDGTSGNKILNTTATFDKYKTTGFTYDLANDSVTSGGHTVDLIDLMSGPNDGLVDEESAKWGTYRGLIDGNDSLCSPSVFPYCGGVDHFQINNNFLGNTPGFDPEDFWVNDLLPEIQTYEDNRTDV